MSEDDHIENADPHAPIPFRPPRRRWRRRGDGERPPKPRVRKLRLLLILVGLGALAFVSTVFGMMMAVASDLPQLENRREYKHEANTFLYDDQWRPIGIFAPPNNVVIDQYQDIAPAMRYAIVSIEDKRFWTNPGVDIRGIARAFVADITGGSRQGASTIAQQFVKNALAEQSNRTVLEKLREAALAYHLTRKWKKKKILTEYLNSIYFGNGAYGIESAARVYFGKKYGFVPAAAAGQTLSSDGTSSTVSGGCGDSSPRRAAAEVRLKADAVGCRPARRDGRVAIGVRSDRPSARRQGPAQRRAQGHAPAGTTISQLAVRPGDQRSAADRGRHPAAVRADRRAVLHELAAPADPCRGRSRRLSRRSPSTARTTAA